MNLRLSIKYVVLTLALISGVSWAGSTPSALTHESLTPLPILKKATDVALTFKPDAYAAIVDRAKLEAVKEIALVQARAGDKAASAANFEFILRSVTATKNFSPEAKELQERNHALHPQTTDFFQSNDRSLILNKIDFAMQMANAQQSSGDTRGAGRAFAQAAILAEELPDDDTIAEGRRWALEEIANAQLNADNREGAEATIQRLAQHVVTYKGVTKDEIVRSLANSRLRWLGLDPSRELGDRKELTAAVERNVLGVKKLEDNWIKGFALRDIAIAHSRLGDNERAFATLQKMVDTRAADQRHDSDQVAHYNMIDVLKVAKAFIAADNKIEAEKAVQMAVRMVQAIPGDDKEAHATRSVIWQEIAITRARMGDVPGALNAQSAISDTGYIEGTLGPIARAQIKAGHLEEARQTAKRSTERSNTNIMLAELAQAQAAHGDIQAAMRLVDSMDKRWSAEKASAIRAITAAKVRTGEPQQAYDLANSLGSPESRTYALLGVAEGLLSEKEHPEN